ncbi:MAG: hypothetical protein RLZ44_307, partial [Pseudomonadota bacterium]
MRTLLERMNALEAPICLRWSRRGDQLEVQRFFAVVSRLGDGVFWYLVMCLLPTLYGAPGLKAALHMLLVGAVSLALYKALKVGTTRARPCDFDTSIRRHAPALDRYSFPSGHTMHAVGFTLVIAGYFPPAAVLVAPFAALVAVSRLVLGLHYPSDVLVGALIGATVAA